MVDTEPIFQRVFPRFAYRWKYKDGEYSALSAFTEVAFLPDDDYKYDANDGYNLSMENTVRRVILSDFDIALDEVIDLISDENCIRDYFSIPYLISSWDRHYESWKLLNVPKIII